MTSKKPRSYSLNTIASWQLDTDKSKVKLPNLQRGFVWKVAQIEELWDSLLRGYPIGSFLLSTSDDSEELFIMDGQQRATSIALGFYNPWYGNVSNFWSIKNIPVLWIDINPSDKTITQKFVIRVITQSHPWGYQLVNHNKVLSVSDRRNALSIFKENPVNSVNGYTALDPRNVFPYDATLPVPLAFLIEAIHTGGTAWNDKLITLCLQNLPVDYIKTKRGDQFEKYIDRLTDIIGTDHFKEQYFTPISEYIHSEIPGIIFKKDVLQATDSSENESTLFVRLNASGTRIAGEELIYSIYKATFPKTRQLVESIGQSFMAPSTVISIVTRLISSEMNYGQYPSVLTVNDFRKRINEPNFRLALEILIGDLNNSPITNYFNSAFSILLSKDQFNLPPVLVKNIVKSTPDLFLMMLQWIKLNDPKPSLSEKKRILAGMTSLCWFVTDQKKSVQEIWGFLASKDLWTSKVLSIPFLQKRECTMHPLINPELLRTYLIYAVTVHKVHWNDLYPDETSTIMKDLSLVLATDEIDPRAASNILWDNFINKIFWNKSFLLFAQRKYINDNFGDFNQMETLEDTNTPWDWDHIYPVSWVYAKQSVNPFIRHWTNSIGNFRALALEENRSENDSWSPRLRLENSLTESFIKDNDWKYWSQIDHRIYDDDRMISTHSNAIIERMCNIYKDWFDTLEVSEIFGAKNFK